VREGATDSVDYPLDRAQLLFPEAPRLTAAQPWPASHPSCRATLRRPSMMGLNISVIEEWLAAEPHRGLARPTLLPLFGRLHRHRHRPLARPFGRSGRSRRVVRDSDGQSLCCATREALRAGVIKDALVGEGCSPSSGKGIRYREAAVDRRLEIEARPTSAAQQVCFQRSCYQRHRKVVARFAPAWRKSAISWPERLNAGEAITTAQHG
jgi:hypothetical protein